MEAFYPEDGEQKSTDNGVHLTWSKSTECILKYILFTYYLNHNWNQSINELINLKKLHNKKIYFSWSTVVTRHVSVPCRHKNAVKNIKKLTFI